MTVLPPLTFRISPDESVQMIASHLGARLPPEYRRVGIKLRVDVTPEGIVVTFDTEPKKVSWLRRLAIAQGMDES